MSRWSASFRRNPVWWQRASYVVIILVAVIPRIASVGQFVTFDEGNFWVQRSTTFLDALQHGNAAATAISTHPGVTTMWLGSAGILLHRALLQAGVVHDASFATVLGVAQLVVGFVNALGVVAGYWLLRRLIDPVAAFLAAMLWAADPFVVGFDRVLHVDGLTATFAILSLLAGWLVWGANGHRAMLLVSAVCGALAVLSKSPGAIVVPMVGLIAVTTSWPHGSGVRGLAQVARAALPSLALWMGVFGLALLAVYPALWADPMRVATLMLTGVEVEGGRPHQSGNFFLGQPDNSPGPLFYPVALALRTTPWSLLGLLVLPLTWWRTPKPDRRMLAMLAGFVIMFVLAMSLFPKRFNRYLIPCWPAVDILAAYGLAALARWLPLAEIPRRAVAIGIAVAVSVVACVNAVFWHPYEMAAFNQVLGGAQAGARTFIVGWGEGMEQVATWLNQQPDITGVVTATPRKEPLQPYLIHGAQSATPPGDSFDPQTGYVVMYVRDTQGGVWPPFDQFYGKIPPLYTVTIHGVEYAWVWQMPQPLDTLRPATFGSDVALRGYSGPAEIENDAATSIRLFWSIQTAPKSSYTLFAHVIGPDGKRYAQVDLPLPTDQWQANRYEMTDLPFQLPANAPPGEYHVFIGLYNPANGERLPVQTNPLEPADTGDGSNALLLQRLWLR